MFFLGQVNLFAFSFAPTGWLLCDGSLLPINQYTALYSLLGANYGGDGLNNFAIPDLRGAAVSSANGAKLYYYICIFGTYPPRS